MEGVDGQPNQQILNLGVEGSNMQEHNNMDQENHSMANPPFGFDNPHVLQSHVQNPQHVFDRNGAINAYNKGLVFPGGKFPNVNFHDMSMQQPKPHGDGFSDEEDDYGHSPQRRKLDDVVQRQKHSNREKKRRNEMNDSIEALKLLLPQSDKSRFRVTKVSILNEAIEYIQRIKELCLVLAKDKREIHEDNCRLHQQLISLGKDVGELRRWDDRNLMETLQSSVSLNPNPLRDAGQMDFQNDFGHPGKRFDGPPFPFPAHLGPPFGHPGMPMMHPGMRMGRPPMMGGPMDFNNPMGFPMFHPGRVGPNGQVEHPAGFPMGFPQQGEPGQDLNEAQFQQFQQQQFQQGEDQQQQFNNGDGQEQDQQHQEHQSEHQDNQEQHQQFSDVQDQQQLQDNQQHNQQTEETGEPEHEAVEGQ
jgi:hypothetical protein